MDSFGGRLSKGFDSLGDLGPLALVPVVLSLLDVRSIRGVLEFEGIHLGISFPFPSPTLALWSFVDAPAPGSGAFTLDAGPYDLVALADQSGFREALLAALAAALVGALVQAALAAGLVGSVHEYLTTGSYAFLPNALRYFAPFFVVQALFLLAFVVAAPAVLAVPPLILPLGLAVLAAGYLFYAAEYLIVVRDLSAIEGLVASYRLAVAGGPYWRFGLAFLATMGAVSIVATPIVVNGGIAGVLLGVVVAGPLGVVANVAVTDFAIDLAERRADLLPGSSARYRGSGGGADGFDR